MMAGMHRFPSISEEHHVITIETDTDPTGSPPDFLVVSAAGADPDAWQAGSWIGTWSEHTGRVVARSATYGDAAADLPMDADMPYKLLMRFGSAPVREVAWLFAYTVDPDAAAAS